MVQPRRYTREQILFVLGLVGEVKNVEIIQRYNKRFQGENSQITAKQLKYIRLTYGSDPNFGAVLYNRVRKGDCPPSEESPRSTFSAELLLEVPPPARQSPVAEEMPRPRGRRHRNPEPKAPGNPENMCFAPPATPRGNAFDVPQPEEGFVYPEPPGWEHFVHATQEDEEEFFTNLVASILPGGDEQNQTDLGGPPADDGGAQEGGSTTAVMNNPGGGPTPYFFGPHEGCSGEGFHCHNQDGAIEHPSLDSASGVMNAIDNDDFLEGFFNSMARPDSNLQATTGAPPYEGFSLPPAAPTVDPDSSNGTRHVPAPSNGPSSRTGPAGPAHAHTASTSFGDFGFGGFGDPELNHQAHTGGGDVGPCLMPAYQAGTYPPDLSEFVHPPLGLYDGDSSVLAGHRYGDPAPFPNNASYDPTDNTDFF